MIAACEYTLGELIEAFKDQGLSYNESGLHTLVSDGVYVSIRNNDEYEAKGGAIEAIGFILIHLKDGYGILPYTSADIETGMERLVPRAFRYAKTDDALTFIQIQRELMGSIKMMDEVMHKMRLPLLFEDITPEKIKEWRGF